MGIPAEVSEAFEIKTSKPGGVPYHVNTSESEVLWTGQKPLGKHTGIVGIQEGIIEIREKTVTGGKIIFDMDKIEVPDLKNDEDTHMKLVEHLKSIDFFDVENHPYTIFEIVKVEPLEKDGNEVIFQAKSGLGKTKSSPQRPTHKVTGNLTMRGTTLNISFPAYVQITAGHLKAKADFIIDRTLWKVQYNDESEFGSIAQDQFIYDDVLVEFNIIAIPPKEIL